MNCLQKVVVFYFIVTGLIVLLIGYTQVDCKVTDYRAITVDCPGHDNFMIGFPKFYQLEIIANCGSINTTWINTSVYANQEVLTTSFYEHYYNSHYKYSPFQLLAVPIIAFGIVLWLSKYGSKHPSNA